MATSRIIGHLEILTADNGDARQWFERFHLFCSANGLYGEVNFLVEDNSDAAAVTAAK